MERRTNLFLHIFLPRHRYTSVQIISSNLSTDTTSCLWNMLADSVCITHGKSNVRHRLPSPSSSPLNDIPFRPPHSSLSSSRNPLRPSPPLYLPCMGLGILQIHHRRDKHLPLQPRLCRFLYHCRRILLGSAT